MQKFLSKRSFQGTNFFPIGCQILNHLLFWKTLFCTELFANNSIENDVRFFWSEMFKWFLNETHGFERSFIHELLSTGALISLMHVVALRVSVPMSLPANITHKLTYNDFISRFVSCKISDSFNVNAFLKLFFLKLFLITKSKFYCCVLGTCIFLGYFPVRKNVVFKCCFDEIQDLIDLFSDYVN